MSVKMIQDRLRQYQPKNQLEEESAIKEITQEVALTGLSRAGFFKIAAFQGGTCLRILYGLNRFSEDLDFVLMQPNQDFDWVPYLKSLKVELEAYGYLLEIQDRSNAEKSIKVGFLKDDSIGKILVMNHRNQKGSSRSIKIKLEIDTNPPAGSTVEQKYIDFPVTVPILAHDSSSLFSGKSHALLCRPWAKGRDWYDFIWYVGRKTQLNYELMSNAINQVGPWKKQGIKIDKGWYLNELRKKIQQTNWEAQKSDVIRFLKQSDQDLLEIWSTEFFMNRLELLEANLK